MAINCVITNGSFQYSCQFGAIVGTGPTPKAAMRNAFDKYLEGIDDKETWTFDDILINEG